MQTLSQGGWFQYLSNERHRILCINSYDLLALALTCLVTRDGSGRNSSHSRPGIRNWPSRSWVTVAFDSSYLTQLVNCSVTLRDKPVSKIAHVFPTKIWSRPRFALSKEPRRQSYVYWSMTRLRRILDHYQPQVILCQPLESNSKVSATPELSRIGFPSTPPHH